MEIQEKDLGKIVELKVKPEWGPGIITKLENRFVYILFKDIKEKTAKRFFLSENPLKLADNQDEPGLTKRARVKNRKIKLKFAAPKPV
jgi:hypothetical protein